MKLTSAIALTTLTALSLLAVACGDESPPQATEVTSPPSSASPPGTAPPDTSPPGTNPPSTNPPSTQPPATDAPTDDPDLPLRPIEIDDGAFETLHDLGEGAELIVLGTVMDESSLGRPVETNDPSADEYLGLTIKVESVIKGEPIAAVLLAWDAYQVDADGQRIASNVMNGIPVPHIGDQLLLFLRPVDAQFAALLHGFPTHTPVALDGIGFVEDGAVSISDNSSPNVAQLVGKTIDEITELL
jgi:hypothetical protein